MKAERKRLIVVIAVLGFVALVFLGLILTLLPGLRAMIGSG
jgi:hypothetical protein